MSGIHMTVLEVSKMPPTLLFWYSILFDAITSSFHEQFDQKLQPLCPTPSLVTLITTDTQRGLKQYPHLQAIMISILARGTLKLAPHTLMAAWDPRGSEAWEAASRFLDTHTRSTCRLCHSLPLVFIGCQQQQWLIWVGFVPFSFKGFYGHWTLAKKW